MRFAFDDDQLALRDGVRALLAKACSPEVVRAAWPEGAEASGARPGDGARAPAGALEDLWRGLADMGTFGVAVDDADGGMGLGPLEWVLVAEEVGAAAVPGPVVDTLAVAAPLLAAAGDPGGHLAGVIAGQTVVATQLDPAAPLVPHAGVADLALVADAPDGRGRNGGSGDADRWVLGPVDELCGDSVLTLDRSRRARRLAHPVAAGTVLDIDPAARTAIREAGVIGAAAELVGLARRMLDMTVAHVSERRQFGKPVGAQQAVKHQLADVARAITFAAPAVHRAAHSLAIGADTRVRDAAMAKVLASDAAQATARAAWQCHGAIGYTVEYDLHLFAKRAEALARAWGDAAWQRDRVARALAI